LMTPERTCGAAVAGFRNAICICPLIRSCMVQTQTQSKQTFTSPIPGPSRRQDVPLVRAGVHSTIRERCRYHLSAAPRSPAL
jgi:hypothetical protein